MPTPLRVVTFNLRHDNPNDGPNAWPHRRAAVAATLRQWDADFVGFQEVLPHQAAQLREDLPDYASLGRSRDPSPDTGEACPIFYRRDRWTLDPTAQGTFWLSEAPEVVASKSWDSSLPRIATWGRFTHHPTGRPLLVLNTHLDHRGPEARRRGAQVLLDHVAAHTRPEHPAIILGDFNTGPASEPLRALADAGFRDAYTAAGAAEGATFHDYGRVGIHERIDYILTRGPLRPVAARIHTDRPEDVHLSDHYPVVVDLEWD